MCSDERWEEIEKVTETAIRPKLMEHGGDIELLSLENGILRVKMKGCCAGCPSANITAETIILCELNKAFADIEQVVVVTEISDELMEMGRKILRGEISVS